MSSTMGRAFCLGMLYALLPGCVGVPARIESRFPAEAARGIVYVVDGAGGFQTAPRMVAEAVSEAGLPLHVRSFDWTHGRGRWLSDEVDQGHSAYQAQRLAAEICLCRQTYPTIPISLVAYSAGAVVAMEAAALLPPDSLERVVLLAPAVSPEFELRPVLASARQGVDVFTSGRDVFRLGLATTIVGTADGRHEPSAGLRGFCPPALSPCDACLASRLRQHPWDSSMAWTGNMGGHSGGIRPTYLKAYVLPLLAPPNCGLGLTAPLR